MCTSWLVQGSIELEKRGIPTVSNITSEFVTLAETCAIGLGVDHLPIAVMEHPLGGIDSSLAAEKAEKVIDDIIEKAINCMPRSSSSSAVPYPAPFVSVTDTIGLPDSLSKPEEALVI